MKSFFSSRPRASALLKHYGIALCIFVAGLVLTYSGYYYYQQQDPFAFHWKVLVPGLILSFLVSSYFLILVHRRILIEQEVQDRTNELASINQILQDEIHERQRIQKEMISNEQYLQKRHETLKYFTKLTTSELRNAVHEVIMRTAAVMQIDRVGVWFYEDADNHFTLTCFGLYSTSSNAYAPPLSLSSAYYPSYFKSLLEQTYIILPSSEDASLNQEMSSYLAPFQILTKLDIPIVFEGKLLGLLSCEETRNYRHWSLEDCHFGQAVADVVAIMIEQSARRKVEKALQESEKRLRFITQSSIDGIISVSSNEEILSWNDGAEQLFGYKEEEIVGKSLREILPNDDFFYKNKPNIRPIELTGRHKDGRLFTAEISHTHCDSDRISFNTLIVRDVTARKEHEKQLVRAIRDANAANAAKSEFLATISHELRTPLNAIIGFNQCLLMGMDGPLSPEQEASLKRIEKSSLHLLNLISDILDWSKIEAKKMEIEFSQHNIVEIAASCFEEMQPLAQQKNLYFELSMDASFILVEVDRMRLRQVFLNLLSNAIKFTEKGFVKVAIFDEPMQVRVEVSDSGIGLSQQEMDRLFVPFSQADSSITRKYGGSGLGLVISQNIINLHRGTLTVVSEKGRGAIFTFSLPKAL